MATAKRYDFCFITFKSRKDALHCIDEIKCNGIASGSKKVLLRASLKRPEKKFPLNFGIQRDYMDNTTATKGFKSYGIGHSNFKRPIRTHEFDSRYYNGIMGNSLDTFTSKDGEHRTILTPTLDAHEEQPRKYVWRVPGNFESSSMKIYVRDIREKFKVESSREYSWEVFRDFESRFRREYVREIPEHLEGHSSMVYLRELPESYEGPSRRVYVCGELLENHEGPSRRVYVREEEPEKYVRYHPRLYVRGIPEKFGSCTKRVLIEEPENLERWSRMNFVMDSHGVDVARGRSRGHYLEGSSSRNVMENHRDSLEIYAQSRGPYYDDGDDIYDMPYERYECREVGSFDGPTFTGIKR